VAFVDKFGQKQTMLVVSTMRCMVRTLPTVVKLRCPEPKLVAAGDGEVKCSLILDRTPNFTGPMQIQLLDPAPGISAEPVTIGADETSVDMVIQLDQSIAGESTVPLRFRAVGAMEDDVQVVSETTVQLVSVTNAQPTQPARSD
jgi:hypothetical protein